jgi:hypothetical protein
MGVWQKEMSDANVHARHRIEKDKLAKLVHFKCITALYTYERKCGNKGAGRPWLVVVNIRKGYFDFVVKLCKLN